MTFAKTEHGTLNYTVAGSGPPILFLPSKGLDYHIFDGLSAALSSDYTCIQLDNLGSGKSDAPRGSYSIDPMAQMTASVIESLGYATIHVVGHSMGGYIGMQLAHDYPQLVSKLVLISTSSCGAMDCLGTTPRATAAMTRKTGSPLELFRRNLTVFMGQTFIDDHPEEFERFVTDRVANRASGRGYAGQHDATTNFDIRDALYRIQSQCLVIHGAADQLISLTRAVELARELDDAQLITLKKVGHFPTLESPKELEQAIRTFLTTS